MNKDNIKFDAVLALPFGTSVGELSANWYIAKRATYLSTKLGLPLVAHIRVPIKSVLVKSSLYGRNQMPVVEVINGKTIFDSAMNFYSVAGYETWKNILIITAPPIMHRCARDIERVSGGMFSVKGEHALTLMGAGQKYAWFDTTDKQLLARYLFLRKAWEVLIGLVPWALYRWFAHTKK